MNLDDILDSVADKEPETYQCVEKLADGKRCQGVAKMFHGRCDDCKDRIFKGFKPKKGNRKWDDRIPALVKEMGKRVGGNKQLEIS